MKSEEFIDKLIKDSFRCPHCQREDGKCVELVSVYDIIKKVKDEARREREMMITILEQLKDYTDYSIAEAVEFIKLLDHDFIGEIRRSLKSKGASKEDFNNFLKKEKELSKGQ